MLAARGVGKSFGDVRVLDGIDVAIRGGEVHTIMGENGAGKSTLMKILAGVHRPDGGEVLVDGKPTAVASPRAASDLGIRLIHQEPLSFGDLSVAENIFLGHGLPRGRLGQIDWRAMRREAARLLTELGVELDPRAKLRGLSIADQQTVELAAALSTDARVLLMDEPTAALTPAEVERLFGIVRGLRDRGVAVVFVSHRLPEVFEISDRITVLRDGNFIGTHNTAETTPDEIIRMMVGRELGEMYAKPDAAIGEPLLEVSALTRRGEFEDVSLTVRAGEIVGLAGLVGAGRTEVARAVFGATRADAGSVRVNGEQVRVRSPHDAIHRGIAYVPEDRQQHGLVLPMSIASNTSLARLADVSSASWLSQAKERAIGKKWADQLKTRLASVTQPAGDLSGGNQQKVVLGKWLQTEPRVLIVDEPTRGIDVGAKAEVHRLLAELAGQGKAVLMISSDLPEVLAMSDRVLVMGGGRITGEFARGEATQESIMAAAVKGGGAATASAAASWTRHFTRFREAGIGLFVLLAFVACLAIEPRFGEAGNLRAILNYIPIIATVAMGQMMVVVSRNIDLSVGSMIGLSAIVGGGLFATNPDTPIAVATLAAVGVGLLLGLVNGGLVAGLGVPAIIATLGTLTAYRGLIFVYSGTEQVDNSDLPRGLTALSNTGPLGVPWLVVVAGLLALGTFLFLRYTQTGRNIYAIGSNPKAAVLRGVPVRRTLLLIFALTGALSGLAGMMFASRYGYVNPSSAGQTLELVIISAVVIGGVNVFGGSGSVGGVLLGCLLLGIVGVGLPILGVSAFWQLAFYGAAILAAASLDTLVQRRGAA